MGEDRTAAYLAEIGRRTAGYHVVPSGRPDAGHFRAYSSCDVCGSMLGGDRYPVAFLPVD